MINKGNEDSDSFKTFLFKSINLNFCENKAIRLYPYGFSYTGFLKDLIWEVQKKYETKAFLEMRKDARVLYQATNQQSNIFFKSTFPEEITKKIISHTGNPHSYNELESKKIIEDHYCRPKV